MRLPATGHGEADARPYPLSYQNFDLWIERDKPTEHYRAKGFGPSDRVATVAASTLGDLETPDLPWTPADVQEFGERLFEAVFHGDVLSIFRASLEEARGQGQGLRLRLRLQDAPELARLPWEYLYDSTHERFFALSRRTPLVRYLELPEPTVRPQFERPLRILVVATHPKDLAPLDSGQEWKLLEDALAGLKERGLVDLQRLETPTWSSLQRTLRRYRPHVLHFIGHGLFQESTNEGALIFETEAGQSHRVGSKQLGMILHDASLRLAFLNACSGAVASSVDVFSGVAQSLVQQGVSAVVAMGFEIDDDIAIGLTAELYSALADGFPVDASLAEARKSLTGQDSMEWGTPVLFQRLSDGHLFEAPPRAAESPQAKPLAGPMGSEPARTPRSKLERLALVLGVVVALLSIAGAVLDLPGKWNAWRVQVAQSSKAKEAVVESATQVLHGEVLDDASGLPLVGALVEVREFGQTMTTDSRGQFAFELLAPQDTRVRVRVSLEGFEVKNEDPMLGTGQFQVYRLKRMKP